MDYHPSGKSISPENIIPCLTILNQLGNAYLDLEKSKKAKDYLEQALRLIPNDVHLSLKASIYNNLGNAYSSLGQYQEAIEYYQAALQLFQQLGNPYNVILCLDNLGKTYRVLKQYLSSVTLGEP